MKRAFRPFVISYEPRKARDVQPVTTAQQGQTLQGCDEGALQRLTLPRAATIACSAAIIILRVTSLTSAMLDASSI